MIVGEIGTESTEIMQMSAAVTSATSFTIDRSGQGGGLRYDHPVGTPVYRIDFNRVEFSRNATTNSTTGVSVITTIRIQPDDEFTRHDDTDNTIGFGFARFNNETTDSFSSYSDGVNYEELGESASRDPRTLFSMRKKTRQLLDEIDPNSRLTDSMIDEALNDHQRSIAHIRLWTFYEDELSFAIVANQFAYDIPTSVQTIHGIRFDTQPLLWITKAEFDARHWDTDQSTMNPAFFSIFSRQILIVPRPSSASSTTAINDGSGITATSTSVTVDSTTGFNRGDYYRFIIGTEVIYATGTTSTTAFTGLLRGREGTTAAAHSNNDTITERDIVYSVHVEPTDLVNSHDRTAIPEPDIIIYGAIIDLAPFVSKEEFISVWEVKYQRRIDELKEKYSSKQTMIHGRIKDISERLPGQMIFSDPNLNPRNVN